MSRVFVRLAAVLLATLAMMGPFACSSAPPNTTASGLPIDRQPGGGACMPFQESEQIANKVKADNEESFRKAVAEKGLEIVPLKGYTVEKPNEGSERLWSVSTNADETKRILAGPPGYHACTGPDPSWIVFARNAAGNLVFLQRTPKATRERVTRICGCEADAPARGCGVAPRMVQWFFELPDGVNFEKEVEIAYPTEATREEFAGRGSGTCPEPIPLP